MSIIARSRAIASLAVAAGVCLNGCGFPDDPKANLDGTVTSVVTYAGHARANVTATSTGRFTKVTDPKTGLVTARPLVTTGDVRWNRTAEMCLRRSDGTTGCWYADMDYGSWKTFRVGQRVAGVYVDEICAPHPAPSDEAADERCPAFAAGGDRVVPAVTS